MSQNSRPAKRPRRSTTILSDDEDDISQGGPTLPLRNIHNTSKATTISTGLSFSNSSGPKAKRLRTAATKSAIKTSSARSSPKSSPDQSKKSQKLSIDNGKNKSLHNFFNRVNEEERWRQRSATPDTENHQDLMDDIVDDDSLDEALSELAYKAEPETSPAKVSFSSRSASAAAEAKPSVSSSQRFRAPIPPKPSLSSKSQLTVRQDQDVRPWAELYAPQSLDDLGVHKKKVQDVQSWILGALAGRIKQRILVLRGPAGSGKSTSIDLICHAQQCQVVRWRNPDTSDSGALSSSLQFAEFITRGGDYGALSLDMQSQDTSSTSQGSRLLLVEDFPASLTLNSVALDSFRTVLLQAALSSSSNNVFGRSTDTTLRPPIVLLISETLVSSSTGFSDSFTAHRLLGPELINHYGVLVTDFNPVAPTYLSKALDLVIKKEARDSGRRRIPGPALLQKLAEMGDIRNAVNSLQLLCTKGDESGDWSGTVAARTNPKRGVKSNQNLSAAEENSMKLISSRETTLDMFHAAGKVCYNKRDDPSSSDTRAQPPPKPPDHLMHLYKPEVSQVDVEDLLNETGTDIQTFIATVHQNYVLSCNHDDFTDYFDGCASFLSDSELLDPDSRILTRSRARAGARNNTFQLGTSDTLRQDEISFNVATRGILFSLPYPVSRAALPGARKMDTYKMFYPASLRIWKPTEENNDLIDFTVSRMLGKESTRSSKTQESSGVSSWRTRSNAFATQSTSFPTDSEDGSTPRLDLGKNSLILDTLPYMTTIKSSRSEDVTILKKITQMRGFDVSADGEAEEETSSNSFSAAARLTQRVEAVHETLQVQKKSQQQPQGEKKKSSVSDDLPVEKLWIEDDEIEDDW